MEDHLPIAKRLFAEYYGNYFQMSRAGYYETYKGYEITKEQETKWYEELIAKNVGELSIRNGDALAELVSIAKNKPDNLILHHVITFADRHVMSSDSIVKLMYAENIIAIVKLVRNDAETELLHRAFKAAADLLDDIMTKPLIVDPGHELQSLGLKDKRGLNLRAAKSIDMIKELLASDQ
ncbi:hypothetical protein AB4Z29_04545 [Paenibacillus sp. 2TAB23]|uniref:hypothetical protein n=1 Tax=Paenibacillus sp. 2TAB23 TaxID=3233004 RepID=UPI003F9961F5